MKKREFKISFFLHVWEKKAEEISLEEFHNDLRGARWKVLAESYRRWMRTGMTEEGKRLKGALNAVVVAGKCRGGHAANQVTELNGLALFDFDHCLEMLAGMKEKAGALPYVVGAFVSISGEGLKLIVRIDAENAGQYAVLILSLPVNWNGCWGILAICRAAIWDGRATLRMIRRRTIIPVPGCFRGGSRWTGCCRRKGSVPRSRWARLVRRALLPKRGMALCRLS